MLNAIQEVSSIRINLAVAKVIGHCSEIEELECLLAHSTERMGYHHFDRKYPFSERDLWNKYFEVGRQKAILKTDSYKLSFQQ